MDRSGGSTQSSQISRDKLEDRPSKVRYWGTWITLLLGLAFISEATEAPSMGATGLIMIMCALAYMARKKQIQHTSLGWKITEIVCLSGAALLVLRAILSLNADALTYRFFTATEPLIAVAWTIVAYVVLLNKHRKSKDKII